MTVQMWVFSSALWQDLLVQRGLEVEKVTVLDAPEATNHASYRLFEVRRPDRISSARAPGSFRANSPRGPG
ncbi:hypothetical protein [Streptomyces sp. NPDC091217]|uniref:hypothetical protein n=1 Tax=Streptomyces sp. NPDC091217 TaxID=3365975 RepID=UPI00380799F8